MSCAGAVFVGPVVQWARFGEPEACQNWSKPFWRHSPVLVFDACRKRVKVGFRGRSSSLGDFESVASLRCVTGAALSSVLVEFRGRHGTLELTVFWCLGVDFVAGTSRLGEIALAVARCTFFANPLRTLGVSNRSRCGDVRILSAPGCRFRGKRVTLSQRDRSRCGAVHILSMRNAPSAHFGFVKSLSLWRGARFEHAKRTLCALWVGQIALAVARCAF